MHPETREGEGEGGVDGIGAAPALKSDTTSVWQSLEW